MKKMPGESAGRARCSWLESGQRELSRVRNAWHDRTRPKGSEIVNEAPLNLPYPYGIIRCMKKTLYIDDGLLQDARSVSGAKTDTDTVRLGLRALIRQAAYQRLRSLRGSEPGARAVRRRRERAASTAHSA